MHSKVKYWNVLHKVIVNVITCSKNWAYYERTTTNFHFRYTQDWATLEIMSYRRNWEFYIIIMLKNKTHNIAFFFAENSCLSPFKRHSARISQKKADARSDRLC